MNEAAGDALGIDAAEALGADLWTALPALHESAPQTELQASMADGRTRTVRAPLPGGHADVISEIRISRAANGWLLLEPSRAVPSRNGYDEDYEPLRHLARQLAEVPDSRLLLDILCNTVMATCGADGVGVGQLVGSDGIVLTGSGNGALEAGLVFPIAGSLAETAIAERRLVSSKDYASGDYPLKSWAREHDIGELLTLPLYAGEQVLGILTTYRFRRRPPFAGREKQRLRLIADHASLALYKAKLLADAEAASRAQSNFLASVSHELRTPLTALTGYGELLADEILGPLAPPQRDMVERMRAVTHLLAVQIDEFLTYSSLEAGSERVRAREVACDEILEAAVSVVEPLARQKGLDFGTASPRVSPILTTDPDKVRLILVNLGGNAVKFTDSGRVDVSVAQRNGVVRFSVRDTGIGIAANDYPRLFQPFTQLDGGLTRRHGGTGLGLYICRRLADLLGGRIDLESETGVGSTFVLTLPVRYTPAS